MGCVIFNNEVLNQQTFSFTCFIDCKLTLVGVSRFILNPFLLVGHTKFFWVSSQLMQFSKVQSQKHGPGRSTTYKVKYKEGLIHTMPLFDIFCRFWTLLPSFRALSQQSLRESAQIHTNASVNSCHRDHMYNVKTPQPRTAATKSERNKITQNETPVLAKSPGVQQPPQPCEQVSS